MRFKNLLYLLTIFTITSCTGDINSSKSKTKELQKRPNILFCVSDDMSWQHTSLMGYSQVKTPGLDRVAKLGITFNNAYSNAPSCSASRAAILTGRNGYELEDGGDLWGILPSKFISYQDILEDNGYFVGYTGKGWGPGNIKDAGRTRNPAGPVFDSIQENLFADMGNDHWQISDNNYSANFKDFLSKKPTDKPFSFWYSSIEPHRDYIKGIGEKSGMNIDSIVVPDFLPNTREVRSDIADYLFEIQWYDNHLVKMLAILEERGELENTIIVVTSDNGMPFPRAKATLYEYGIHMPLSVCWGDRIKGDREVSDIVSLIDFAPTFLEAAGIVVPENMSGKSLMDIFKSEKSGQIDVNRNKVVTFRERHSMSQPNKKANAQRAIRKNNHLLIWNLFPNMWPLGHPSPKYNWDYTPFSDSDTGPTEEEVLKEEYYKNLAFSKRPEYELYNIGKDPYQLHNLASDKNNTKLLNELKIELEEYLTKTGDPRMINKDTTIFDNASYYGAMWNETTNMPLKYFMDIPKNKRDLLLKEYIKKMKMN